MGAEERGRNGREDGGEGATGGDRSWDSETVISKDMEEQIQT